MTCEERERICNHSFEKLWENLWLNRRDHDKYFREFLKSQESFKKLCATPCFQEVQTARADAPKWLNPEWGFPKGKKNWHEEPLECAMREMREETNIREKGYRILHEFAPVEECFVGTDRRQYRHVYYIAEAQTAIPVRIDAKNIMQVREVGNIGWMTLSECIKKMRPYNNEKIQMLQSVHELITQYCRLLQQRERTPFGPAAPQQNITV
jgi:ADP-ribose pyrophosphatase YjhB (NUDIX family)